MEQQRHRASSAIQLLLMEDVEGLGRKGELVLAKPGHARNFLLPQKKGIVATAFALGMQSKLKEEREKQAVVDRAIAKEIASRVHGITLTLHVKVDQDMHMYGSVKAGQIAEVLEKEGIAVEKKFIALHHPIKEIGVHEIPLQLKEGITCRFQLKVLPEGLDELPAALPGKRLETPKADEPTEQQPQQE
ncbi:MAG: 50S ribosomal protein L9 [Verrucomicrobia bacterium]|nr:50S ribosomal protein L9 [Verrucomicrobiota bacterium]